MKCLTTMCARGVGVVQVCGCKSLNGSVLMPCVCQCLQGGWEMVKVEGGYANGRVLTAVCCD